ncbi:uncharacterized protein L3040_006851 [Drepanopeziza brunnea f. sp. 'multigermtubi']|nr:hypothetical protein L3040_006851 [Drepanopeziza brunnea f. sp. 'multigermtubi']
MEKGSNWSAPAGLYPRDLDVAGKLLPMHWVSEFSLKRKARTPLGRDIAISALHKFGPGKAIFDPRLGTNAATHGQPISLPVQITVDLKSWSRLVSTVDHSLISLRRHFPSFHSAIRDDPEQESLDHSRLDLAA